MTWLYWLPAIILAIISMLLFLASMGGDNVDARALAGILMLPAIFFAVLAVIAAIAAYVIPKFF